VRSERPRAAFEHLFAMPIDEWLRGVVFLSHGRVQLSAVMSEQDLIEALASVRLFRHQDATIIAQSERADIEELVMETTQRNAILDDIRPTRLMPFDVRCLEADRHIANAQIEIA